MSGRPGALVLHGLTGSPQGVAALGTALGGAGFEVAYDRLPVAALLSLSRGLAALRPRLVDVRCPVLILTSRHDHVVPSVSSDVLADAVSGPVQRVWLERSQHVATLDLDREELERRIVDFARTAVTPTMSQWP